MKQNVKRVLSLVLSVIMVVSGLTITPPVTTNVQAASTADVFITDKIVPVGETSEDYSHMYYWKGQEIELSIAVYADYQNLITWETSDSAISLKGESDTTTAYTGTGSGYVVKQKFVISDDAKGDYTITAKNGSVSKEFKFTVQDSYMTPISSTKYSDFANTMRWTQDKIDLYVVTKAGVKVDFASSNSLVSIESTDTCDSSKLYYYGKGSEVHKVTAVVGDKVDTDTQLDSATITATDSTGKTENLVIQIGQSASNIVNDSITVTCADTSHTHDEITHVNSTKDVIYIDAYKWSEKSTDKNLNTATISFRMTGSVVDGLVYAIDKENKNVGQCKPTIKEVGDNYVDYELTISELSPTTQGSPVYIDLLSISTHMVTKKLGFVIYYGNVHNDFTIKNGTTDIENGIAMDEGQTGTFTASGLVNVDKKEKVTWSVTGADGVLTVNPETGAYTANAVSGTATVTATVKDTNSGQRGQTSSFNVIVKKIVAPDTIEILNANREKATSTTLYVGDNATTFYRSATKGGSSEGIYYPNYVNVLTKDKVVTLSNGSSDDEIQVVPSAKGTTNFYIKTQDGTVNSQVLELKVIAPIQTLTIQKDGYDAENIESVEARELTFTAKRNAEASEDAESIVWSASGSGSVKFLDDNNNECDTYTGDICRVVTKGAGAVTITAKATGLDNRSKAIDTVNMTIGERIPADSVSFFADDELQENNTISTPYEIKSNETKKFTIRGYATNGAASNDEFSGVYEMTATGLTASWVDNEGGFEVKAGNSPGLVTLSFNNEQTQTTYKFYVKVVIPATGLEILDGNNEKITTGLVLQENDECRLYASKTPSNSTDDISWYSSDSSVVSVNDEGDIKVEKYSASPITITAKSASGVEATCLVYVVKPIENITIVAQNKDGNALAMDGTDVIYINDTITASAIILPTDATDKYSWTTSNSAAASITTLEDGSCVITGKGQGTAVISAIPKLLTSAGNVTKTFTITVAKKPGALDVKEANNANAATVTTAGIDLVTTSRTLYAVLDPADSHDVVSWKAEPADVLELNVKNNGTTHSCEIKKLKSGKTVTLTVATSNGIERTVEVRTGISLAECTVTPVESKLYDGTSYSPTVVIKNKDGVELVQGTDYTVTYPRDTTSAGSKEMTITGKGVYCDTITVTYQVAALSITNATVKINNGNNYTYTGSAITLEPARGVAVTVPVGTTTKTLTSNDYDVVCTNNVNAGTASVTITGKGNYTGTIQTTFQIDAKDISKITAQITPTTFEYTGNAVCPAATVKDGTKELVAGTDYVVTYTNNVEVSSSALKPTAIITGKGNYTGTKSITFNITAQELKVENITLSKTDYTYNGKNCKPKVTVRNSNGVKLQADKDYTITYPNDVTNIGIKSITITGKGNYKGNVKAEYGIAEKVTVKKASIKKVKNSKTKKVTIEVKPVSGADGYEISYSTSKKFTKDTTKVVTSKKAKKTIKKLQKGKTYYFKVRAYKVNSIGRTIYGKASAVKKVKIKK